MEGQDAESSDKVDVFMAVTGANKETALRCIVSARGDVDAAVATYMEESGTAGDVSMDRVPEDGSAVDSILGSAKGSEGRGKAAGKGDKNMRTVAIVFFSDGFMVDENIENQSEEEEEEEPKSAAEVAKPVPQRRTGMATLSDFKSEPSGMPGMPGPLPKIPDLAPLRSYESPADKAFLDEVKSGSVPEELRKRDEAGRPIAVSIAVSDLRPKSYAELSKALEQMREMSKQMSAKGLGKGKEAAPSKPASSVFTGAGHTLSGGSSSGPSGASAPAGPGADPGLLAVAGGPVPEVDESKPATTVQLRMASGARVKVRLNLDHTVGDIWKHVAAQMGMAAFKAASNHGLSAGFPPKPLTDPSAALSAADLANASISHRCS
mmetsp:Transcript_62355/g.110817  ORF Transcript_62355/g.110817 Transcript_62355/m.110817 type:complete len:378 (-) Transcript_62355:54-1187(-)|eukprot:CAMPEP_0197663478 /NCGR_PEP_ID=MMETSP1338-20131121/57567_1 /TAXON_ID=43686 ORGANISM="Pelagodinium beii, Strain RCC1491" /NCGR_SAMPLE_ID=MMETSP1338 /ASSEMBLY_ACC=CAM_ASM_000754 /LENGTH=377 /DNA_ID=CAMNT_0043241871 /DNA_START=36 /DNA_END=1169 /DNA_ORIENTATION=+